jgi:transcriptional regulator with XRE-family HTH domain
VEKSLFHERLKTIREEQGLSLRQAAQRAQIPVSTYREWEAGRKIIGEPYEKIARALNVNLYTLMTGELSNTSEVLSIIEKIEHLLGTLRISLGSHTRD